MGSVHDKRIEDPHRKVQVGEVHTGIVAVLDVDPYTTVRLNFRETEIARAWWVPFDQIGSELFKRQNTPEGIDSWTEVAIREFWGDYLASAS